MQSNKNWKNVDILFTPSATRKFAKSAFFFCKINEKIFCSLRSLISTERCSKMIKKNSSKTDGIFTAKNKEKFKYIKKYRKIRHSAPLEITVLEKLLCTSVVQWVDAGLWSQSGPWNQCTLLTPNFDLLRCEKQSLYDPLLVNWCWHISIVWDSNSLQLAAQTILAGRIIEPPRWIVVFKRQSLDPQTNASTVMLEEVLGFELNV